MKKLLLLILLCGIVFADVSVSDMNPREKEIVTFTADMFGPIPESMKFTWNISLNEYNTNCKFDPAFGKIVCNIALEIPFDTMNQNISYTFVSNITNTIQTGTIKVQDISFTVEAPSSAKVGTIFQPTLQIYWEDHFGPPNQILSITSLDLGVNNNYMGASSFTPNVNIPIVNSGVYPITYKMIHGSTVKTVVKNLDIKGRTEGDILDASKTIKPKSYLQDYNFTLETVGKNIGSSQMRDAKLTVTFFDKSKEYACGSINADKTCVNLFSLNLPKEKAAGTYTVKVKFSWKNDDDTIDFKEEFFDILVDKVHNIKVNIPRFTEPLVADAKYTQVFTFTSESNTKTTINLTMLNLTGNFSQSTIALNPKETKNVTFTFFSPLVNDIYSKLKITGDLEGEQELNYDVDNYDFEFVYPDIDWKSEIKNYNFNLTIKNKNDKNITAELSVSCPVDWICNLEESDLNFTSNSNVSVPVEVKLGTLEKLNYDINFTLEVFESELVSTLSINFGSDIIEPTTEVYYVENVSTDMYYFASGKEVIIRQDIYNFENVVPIKVRKELDESWSVTINANVGVNDVCEVYVISNTDKTPYKLKPALPQGLTGEINSKAFLAVRFLKEGKCEMNLKWNDDSEQKLIFITKTAHDTTLLAENEELKQDLQEAEEKAEEVNDFKEWMIYVAIAVVGVVGYATYKRISTKTVPYQQNQRSIVNKASYIEKKPKEVIPLISKKFKEVLSPKEKKYTYLDLKDKTGYDADSEKKLVDMHKSLEDWED